MKAFLLILLILLIGAAAFSQQRNFGIMEVFQGGDSIFIKKLRTVVVNVSEGSVTKMRTPPDTAKLFIAQDGGVYEGVITWRKVGGTTPPVDVPSVLGSIDNVDARCFYFGLWEQFNSSQFQPTGTSTYTKVTGNFVEVTFIGRKIEVYMERRLNHGKAGISIDGGEEVEVDLYNARSTNSSENVWSNTTLLSPGQHKAKIRMKGEKNPLATEDNILFDRVNVVQ